MAGRHPLRLRLSRAGLLEEAAWRRDNSPCHHQLFARAVGCGEGSVEVLVSVPCVIFEDDDLLAVNKPAGINTHAPGPYAGEGIYDWLRHREPRWARLAIIHRLDKETSGVLVFSKTTVANRSLTRQFAQHTVRKSYVLLTSGRVPLPELVATSTLVRAGPKYLSQSVR